MGSVSHDLEDHKPKSALALVVVAIGVVFGDIGTSPLYALKACFNPIHGLGTDPREVLGMVSLVVWAITLVVCVKYLAIVVRADNKGEGGILSLISLAGSVLKPLKDPKKIGRSAGIITILGIIGAALLYSDSILTPAVSVLSAVEGLLVISPRFEPYIIPAALAILVSLFMVQSKGSGAVGRIFGPVTILWFITIAVLGAAAAISNPLILWALNPLEAVSFVTRHGPATLGLLGSVFLAMTGAEVMYADMGHFGKKAIRSGWFSLIYPALILNYLGQGAIILANPATAVNPFFNLAPSWFQYPLVILATMATVIASQAVISGAFSLARQSVQMGFWPRMQIRHTSHETIGQVYVPFINWALMLGTIALVLGFRKSDNLAEAYGIAVSADMLITTCLITLVARRLWKAPLPLVALFVLVFFTVDGLFFAANVTKVISGGWIVVLFAVFLFILMKTWIDGRKSLRDRFEIAALTLEEFTQSIAIDPPLKVPGTAIFLSANPRGVPLALLHNLKHNRILHENTVVLVTQSKPVARVDAAERKQVIDHGAGIIQILLNYGFSETPDIQRELQGMQIGTKVFNPHQTTFFLGREILVYMPGHRNGLKNWRRRLFWFMSHNALSATEFFQLPPDRVVEVGARTEI